MSRDASYPVSSGLPVATRATEVGPSPKLLGGGDLFGYGLLRPFRRDRKLDWAAAGGVRLVTACVGQVLGTRAASDFSQGELPWRTEFGSKLYLLRHAANDDTTRELARIYIAEALVRWEPRVRVTGVEIVSEEVEGLGEVALAIRVRFDLVDRNTAGNAVLLPGLEAVVPLE